MVSDRGTKEMMQPCIVHLLFHLFDSVLMPHPTVELSRDAIPPEIELNQPLVQGIGPSRKKETAAR